MVPHGSIRAPPFGGVSYTRFPKANTMPGYVQRDDTAGSTVCVCAGPTGSLDHDL